MNESSRLIGFLSQIRRPFFVTLCTLVLVHVLAPLLALVRFSDVVHVGESLIAIGVVTAMLLGIHAAGGSARTVRRLTLLGILVPLAGWLDFRYGGFAWGTVSRTAALALALVAGGFMLGAVLRASRVDSDKISASVCVYFLLGVF